MVKKNLIKINLKRDVNKTIFQNCSEKKVKKFIKIFYIYFKNWNTFKFFFYLKKKISFKYKYHYFFFFYKKKYQIFTKLSLKSFILSLISIGNKKFFNFKKFLFFLSVKKKRVRIYSMDEVNYDYSIFLNHLKFFFIKTNKIKNYYFYLNKFNNNFLLLDKIIYKFLHYFNLSNKKLEGVADFFFITDLKQFYKNILKLLRAYYLLRNDTIYFVL